MIGLSNPQVKLLVEGMRLSRHENGGHGLLVSGSSYRTALSLERRGMGTVQYQGPGRGWYKAAAWIEPGKLEAEGQGCYAPERLPESLKGDRVYSRRFLAPGEAAGEWAVVTIYSAAVIAAEYLDSFGHQLDGEEVEARTCEVEMIAEIVRCTDPDDPGSTELESDYEYAMLETARLMTAEDADAMAKRELVSFTVDMLGTTGSGL